MADARIYARSFGGGEVTPEFFGRIDDTKYQTGLAICRNFIVKPHGPVANRGGLRMVRKVKNPGTATRVIPFVFATDQSAVIEMGEGYFRFYVQGAAVLAGAPPAWSSATAYEIGDLVSQAGSNWYCMKAHTNIVPPDGVYWFRLPSDVYEMPNFFLAHHLREVKFVQSNDIITFTHPKYPPSELRRYGSTKWVFGEISFAPTLPPPADIAATAHPVTTNPGTPTLQSYVVTAVRGNDESAASSDKGTA